MMRGTVTTERMLTGTLARKKGVRGILNGATDLQLGLLDGPGAISRADHRLCGT